MHTTSPEIDNKEYLVDVTENFHNLDLRSENRDYIAAYQLMDEYPASFGIRIAKENETVEVDKMLSNIEKCYLLEHDKHREKNPELFPMSRLQPTLRYYKKLGYESVAKPKENALLTAEIPLIGIDEIEYRTISNMLITKKIDPVIRDFAKRRRNFDENAAFIWSLVGDEESENKLERPFVMQVRAWFGDPAFAHNRVGRYVLKHGLEEAESRGAMGVLYFTTWPAGRKFTDNLSISRKLGTTMAPRPFGREAQIGIITLDKGWQQAIDFSKSL